MAHTVFETDGPIATLTFNRPEARNAMTWGMYQRLYDTCEEVDADDPDVRMAMVQRANGRRTVPQIFVGDHHVGGYDDIAALERRGQLDPLLA